MTSVTSTFADGYNTWRTKQVTTLPDGNTQTSYVNFAGQSILDVFQSGTQKWQTFRKYDGNGRIVLMANPSAVSGYDETKPDLLDNQSGNYQYLNDSAGLVETYTYGTSTTASSSGAGDVAGYLEETAIKLTFNELLEETTKALKDLRFAQHPELSGPKPLLEALVPWQGPGAVTTASTPS